jgi:hypothetical protein
MTALNWEKDHARRMPREESFDDLPATGSWADRQRYCDYPSRRNTYRPGQLTPSPAVTRNRCFDFSQLQAYLAHVLHPDFKRRGATQRLEVLNILLKLVNRCQYWKESLSNPEKAAMEKAQSFLKNQAH